MYSYPVYSYAMYAKKSFTERIRIQLTFIFYIGPRLNIFIEMLNIAMIFDIFIVPVILLLLIVIKAAVG